MKTRTKIIGGTAITLAALAMQPATAHADGKLANEYRICQMLEANPSFATIDLIAAGLVPTVGLEMAADDVVDATTNICPQYYGLVSSYIRSRAPYASTPTQVPDSSSIQHHTVV